MEINTKLGTNTARKIGKLMVKASELGMDLSGFGVADENPTSGNVYLWLDDYPFTLYIDLGSDNIWANWTSPEDGEEIDISVGDKSLDDLNTWANDLYNNAISDNIEL